MSRDDKDDDKYIGSDVKNLLKQIEIKILLMNLKNVNQMMKGDIQHGLIGAAIGGLGGALAGGAIGKIKFL